jgi:predicted component of type VI protein secretion system
MSLDEQYEQMQYFSVALDAFNERLRGSVADLKHHHEAVHPLWQDSFRRMYDAEWTEFEERMNAYLQREGPMYEQFLVSKMQSLRLYLFGNG